MSARKAQAGTDRSMASSAVQPPSRHAICRVFLQSVGVQATLRTGATTELIPLVFFWRHP